MEWIEFLAWEPAWLWLELSTGKTGLVKPGGSLWLALQGIPYYVHLLLSAESPMSSGIFRINGLALQLRVLYPGFLLLMVFSSDFAMRYHFCRTSLPLFFEVWSGLIGFVHFLGGPQTASDELVSMCLSETVQLKLRTFLAHGGTPFVLCYEDGSGEGTIQTISSSEIIDMIVSVLLVLFDLLAEGQLVAGQLRAERPGAAPLVASVVQCPGDDGSRFCAGLFACDGSRYILAVHWPLFFTWDGFLN